MNAHEKTLIAVVGPTAIGKTALSIELAQHFHTEIISADSRQIYQELNIGVARPSTIELETVPHHFIASLSIQTPFNAGQFEAQALQVLNTLFQTHSTVICCGGSMLYVDALIHGLDDLPGDEVVRQQLKNELAAEGLEAMQKQLQAKDPEYYQQVDLNNPHRVLRALEVCLLTNQKYSDLRKKEKANRPFRVVKIGLKAQREWLYQRINQRVDLMMEAGLENEVQSTLPYRNLNALNTVGYKEFYPYFDGLCSREEVINKIKQHTRNFAKRQMTWWRSATDIHWIEADKTSSPLKEALAILQSQ